MVIGNDAFAQIERTAGLFYLLYAMLYVEAYQRLAVERPTTDIIS